jgi:hypothetical protein
MAAESAREHAREGPMMTSRELRRLMQEIQVADYELHASFRTIADAELGSEYISAFMDMCLKRDRMMARVLSHVAAQHRRKAYANHLRGNGNGNHASGE